MQEIPTLLGFTAGELSPWLATRYDLQAYQRGAALLKNFVVMPYGGLRRRHGTQFVDFLAEGVDSLAVRLFPFVFSSHDVLMMVFMPGRTLLYRNRVRQNVVLETPWQTAEEIESLQFTQVNDTVYCTTPLHPPVRLTRRSELDWGLETICPEPYPRESYAASKAWLLVDMPQGAERALLTIDDGADAPHFTPDMENREYVMADADVPPRILFEGKKVSFPFTPHAVPDMEHTASQVGQIYYEKDGSSNQYKFYQCIEEYSPAAFNGRNTPAAYPKNFMQGVMWTDPLTNLPYEVCGGWTLRTRGTWNCVWEIWRSYDTIDENPDFRRWQWSCVKTFSQSEYAERQNWVLSGHEDVPCRMVLVCRRLITVVPSNFPEDFLHFEIEKGRREYKMLITKVIDPCHAEAKICSHYCDDPLNFRSCNWSFGAFGPRNGYPRFSSFFQGRLWYGGMSGLPTTLLGSTVDDFDNFRMGSNADSALHLTLAADDQNRINWLCPARQLLIGTSQGEWVLGSGDGAAITATSASFRRQSSVGSEEGVPAQNVENTALFVQRGGRRLREISYKLESDGFAASDTSLMAEHLLQSGIKEFCVQLATDTYVWTLMNDGSVAVLTLNGDQQVLAWQRMDFPQRRVESLASLPDTEGKDDELWLVTFHALTRRFSLECITEDAPFMDLAAEGDAGEVLTAPFLTGFALSVLSDGEHYVHRVGVPFNTKGQVHLPAGLPGQHLMLGVGYESVVRTMPLEGLNSFNAVRQMSRVRLRLLESEPYFSYKTSANEQRELFKGSADAQYPFTGSLRLAQMPQADVGQGFELSYFGARDFRLLSLTIEVDYHGR